MSSSTSSTYTSLKGLTALAMSCVQETTSTLGGIRLPVTTGRLDSAYLPLPVSTQFAVNQEKWT